MHNNAFVLQPHMVSAALVSDPGVVEQTRPGVIITCRSFSLCGGPFQRNLMSVQSPVVHGSWQRMIVKKKHLMSCSSVSIGLLCTTVQWWLNPCLLANIRGHAGHVNATEGLDGWTMESITLHHINICQIMLLQTLHKVKQNFIHK